MYRLLCNENEISHGQRFLLNLVDKRNLARWIRDNSSENINSKKACHNAFQVAIGRNNPSLDFIFAFKELINPILWFYYESEPLPKLKKYTQEKSLERWDFTKSIAYKKLLNNLEETRLCYKNQNLSRVTYFVLKAGKRRPSFLRIRGLREIYYPADWFYYVD